jgi:hypothetical protein
MREDDENHGGAGIVMSNSDLAVRAREDGSSQPSCEIKQAGGLAILCVIAL